MHKSIRVPVTTIEEMHSDLRQAIDDGIGNMALQVGGLASDVRHLKSIQDSHTIDIEQLKKDHTGCVSRIGFTGVNRRIGKLEKFRDRVQDTGLFSAGTGEASGGNVIFTKDNHNVLLWMLVGATIAGGLISRYILPMVFRSGM